ncbi:hypothetical protein BU26DRAFT_567902 [Trematosphaeria pertusa]|uniref:Uncharacterized protein n=1 Tax=Trematosphaeria pertusa TaxID=390896 RepID=A0A6A6I4R5_9PLEO|nr:uncharacterized protein BU26DRAFT_567902 [Trematosphaeria pertusa]KAF2245307.1 hypothetical protein BU26DRAFT_567902 [Trematosphaeria pertusa]
MRTGSFEAHGTESSYTYANVNMRDVERGDSEEKRITTDFHSHPEAPRTAMYDPNTYLDWYLSTNYQRPITAIPDHLLDPQLRDAQPTYPFLAEPVSAEPPQASHAPLSLQDIAYSYNHTRRNNAKGGSPYWAGYEDEETFSQQPYTHSGMSTFSTPWHLNGTPSPNTGMPAYERPWVHGQASDQGNGRLTESTRLRLSNGPPGGLAHLKAVISASIHGEYAPTPMVHSSNLAPSQKPAPRAIPVPLPKPAPVASEVDTQPNKRIRLGQQQATVARTRSVEGNDPKDISNNPAPPHLVKCVQLPLESATIRTKTSKVPRTLPSNPPTMPPGDLTSEILCPSNIVDLGDAWDWIEHMAKTPTMRFQPTVQKVRSGEAKTYCDRHKKHPIPMFMMLAMQINGFGPSTELMYQTGRTFMRTTAVMAPHNLEMNYLGTTELTLIEICAYFSQLIIRAECLDRLIRAGMNQGQIADTVNWVRQLSGLKSSFSHIRVLKRAQEAGRKLHDRKLKIEQRDRLDTVDFSARGWNYTEIKTMDYPLLALAHGVEIQITGEDAGPLTHLIAWCKANGRYRAMLSEVPMLLDEAHILPLIVRPADGSCPDKAAFVRHRDQVNLDRLRVQRSRRKRKANAMAVDRE